MKPSVTAVVPAYNEREGVAGSLIALREVLSEYPGEAEIIAIDDGSTDGTSEILAEVDGVTVITNRRNLGYGAAVKRGIRRAGGDWILITDGDDSYPASNVPELLAAIAGHDMVVGARSVSEIRNPASWNRSKVLFQRLLKALTGQRIPDINSGMRVLRRDLAVALEPILADGFSFSSGLTVGFIRGGFRVCFTGIEYLERKGRSKVRPLTFTPAFLRSVARAYLGAPRIARERRARRIR